MPLATNAIFNGDNIEIEAPLEERTTRTKGQPSPAFTCIECGKPVNPHGGEVTHHFEHRDRNPDCSRSTPA
jgi:hypothetical protein